MKIFFRFLSLLFLMVILIFPALKCNTNKHKSAQKYQTIIKKMPEVYREDVEFAIQRADSNSPEIIKFLKNINKKHRKSAAFLVANMPERDLKNLTADFLQENLSWSYKALDKSNWSEEIPDDIFRNYILPYANVNERRDNWRRDFHSRFYPLVKNIEKPGGAAVELNKRIWDMIGVHYTTDRPKPDQSPYESIEAQGATCTGLSILLIDACRSVGIPARFVGVPEWVYVRGNHSWVEVWDQGWHYLGAGEPGPLNKSWFTERAQHARVNDSLHSIYAVSFQKTDISFPCVWDSDIKYVSAHNITHRYAKEPSESDEITLSIRIFSNNKRISLPVKLYYKNKLLAKGTSPG
ncbi:MAG: transglutaminase-like domain-containing protein, partial [Candidatus Marinimicrobia bacterium]|nr:transglutaminase-like domain-containing protein [Candidatus Neomarinimicrobiota bacterium]